MTDLFKAKGYEVDLARDGATGLDMLKKISMTVFY